MFKKSQKVVIITLLIFQMLLGYIPVDLLAETMGENNVPSTNVVDESLIPEIEDVDVDVPIIEDSSASSDDADTSSATLSEPSSATTVDNSINGSNDSTVNSNSDSSSETSSTQAPRSSRKKRSILPDEATRTYRFYLNKVLDENNQIDREKSKLLETIIIRSGQTLARVETPKQEKMVFRQWVTADGDKFEFSDAPETFTDNQEIDVFAEFANGVTVRYFRKSDEDGMYVLHITDLIPEGESAVRYLADSLPASEKIFSYWSEDKEDVPVRRRFDFETKLTQDISLYAVYEDGFIVTPDSKGGSAGLPTRVSAKEPWSEIKKRIASVNKKGYDFAHWSLEDKKDGEEIPDNYLFSGSTKIYAVWTPRNDTPYLVVNYLENANDNGFKFASSSSWQGTTDTVADLHLNEQKSSLEASLVRADNGAVRDDSVTEYNLIDRADYEPKLSPDNDSKTIAGDGTTVYKVYWKRKTFAARLRGIPKQDFYMRYVVPQPGDEDYDPDASPLDLHGAVSFDYEEVMSDPEDFGDYDIVRREDYNLARAYAEKFEEGTDDLVVKFKWGQNINSLLEAPLEFSEHWVWVPHEGSTINVEDFDKIYPDDDINEVMRDEYTYSYVRPAKANFGSEVITGTPYMPFLKASDDQEYLISAIKTGSYNRLIYRFLEITPEEKEEIVANPEAFSEAYAKHQKGKLIAKDAFTTGSSGLGITQVDIINIKGFTAVPLEVVKGLKVYFDKGKVKEQWDSYNFEPDLRINSQSRIDYVKNHAAILAVYPILYTRNKYTIDWQTNNDKNEVVQTGPYLYETKLKEIGPLPGYEVDKTVREKDGFVFRGWYKDSNLSDPVDFNEGFIDAGNEIFYAKWTPPTVRVTFHRTGFRDPEADIIYGSPVTGIYQKFSHLPDDLQNGVKNNPDLYANFPADPNNITVNFKHWYYYSGNQRLVFDPAQQLDQDYDLYPMWALDYCDVAFLPAEGMEHRFTQRVDRDSIYRLLTYDRYKELQPDAPEIPADKVFVGWKEITTGEDMQSGIFLEQQSERIRWPRVFRAVLRDRIPNIQYTYDPNGAPDEQPQTIDEVINNQRSVAIDNPFTYPGMTFLGWNTKPDGSGTHYMPKEPFLTDKDGNPESNVLYAIWGKVNVVKEVLRVETAVGEEREDKVAKKIGDKIYYKVTISNPNPFKLLRFKYSDDLLGLNDVLVDEELAALNGSKTIEIGTPYIVKDVDFDSEKIINQVDVTADTPFNVSKDDETKQTLNGSSTTETPTNRLPDWTDITIKKTAASVVSSTGEARPDNKAHEAGDVITYQFVITNTGKAVIPSYVIKDVKLLGENESITINDHPLNPGDNYTFTASKKYTVLQEDMNDGEIENTATVEIPIAPVPEGEEPPSSTNVVPVEPNNSFTIAKQTVKVTNADGTIERHGMRFTEEGDKIFYSFSVTNTGNQTITKFNIDDSKIPFQKEVEMRIEPKQTVIYGDDEGEEVTPYVVTPDDLDNGKVLNTVSIKVTVPNRDVPPQTTTNTTPPDLRHKIKIEKSVSSVISSDGTVRENKQIEALGDKIKYSFKITNEGNQTINSFIFSDDNLKISQREIKAKIAAKGFYLYEPEDVYVVTQADLDRAKVKNVAKVKGKSPGGDTPETPSNEVEVPVIVINDFKVEKLTSKVTDAAGKERRPDNKFIAEGDRIYYSFKVTNTGMQTINKVKFEDDLLKVTRELEVKILPGEENAYTYEESTYYTVTKADLNRGVVTNNLTTTVTTPNGELPPKPTKNDTPPELTPSVKVTKSTDKVTDETGKKLRDDKRFIKAGDRIYYAFEIRNTGNQKITSFIFSDNMLNIDKEEITHEIEIGDSYTYKPDVYYTVTQNDVNTGFVNNVATVKGKTPGTPDGGGETPDTPSNNNNTPGNIVNDFTLTKTVKKVTNADESVTYEDKKIHAAGDHLYYSFVVTNTGVQTISSIHLEDDDINLDQDYPVTLEPGQSETITLTDKFYVATQNNLNNGSYTNTVHGKVTTPSGDSPSKDSSVTTPVVPEPELEVVKSLHKVTDKDGIIYQDGHFQRAGDRIYYSFKITNKGNQKLLSFTINDSKLKLNNLRVNQEIEVGATYTYTPDDTIFYEVTQADVDSEKVLNTAKVKGRIPGGPGGEEDTPETPSNEHSTPGKIVNSFKIVKSTTRVTNPDGTEDRPNKQFIAEHDRIYYGFTVKNTGVQTIKSFRLVDDRLNLDKVITQDIAPGDSYTYEEKEVYYEVTQRDLDNGQFINTVTTTVTTPNGDLPPDDSSNTTPPHLTPAISVKKTTAKVTDDKGQKYDDGQFHKVGDRIYYSFEIENTGNQTLSAFVISDSKLDLKNVRVEASLAPGAKTKYEPDVFYTVTQEDLDRGKVLNTANVKGKTPPTDPDDPKTGGETPDTPSNENETPANVENSFEVEKIVSRVTDANGSDYDDKMFHKAGDKIYYSFKITNTGTQTISKVRINDELLGLNYEQNVVVKPGEDNAVTIEAPNPYVVKQVDLDNLKVNNTVSVVVITPKEPNGELPPEDSSTTTPAVPDRKLKVKKSTAKVTDANGASYDDKLIHKAGDRVYYSFEIENIGNMTLSAFELTDAKLKLDKFRVEQNIAPGEKYTYTPEAYYEATQADVDAGKVLNTASVKGKTPPTDPDDPDTGGETPDTPSNENETPVKVENSFTVKKATAKVTDESGDVLREGMKFLAEKDRIYYSFTVTNTGNQSISKIRLQDELIGLDKTITLDEALLPEASYTYSEEDLFYEITANDLKTGFVHNVVTTTVTTPEGDLPPEDSENTTPPQPEPSIKVSKKTAKVTDDKGVEYLDGKFERAGDRIYYSFEIENTGNTMLSALVFSDVKIGLENVRLEQSLAPGETYTYEPDSYHEVTQADVDSGKVLNTATVKGIVPSVPEVPGSGGETPDTPSNENETYSSSVGSIKVVKKLDHATDASGKKYDDERYQELGDMLYYSFEISNTSELTLYKIRLTDEKLGLDLEIAEKLEAGETITYTPDQAYVISAQDIETNKVVNLVKVEAVDENGNISSADDEYVVPYVEKEKPTVPTVTGTTASSKTDPKVPIAKTGENMSNVSLILLLFTLVFATVRTHKKRQED